MTIQLELFGTLIFESVAVGSSGLPKIPHIKGNSSNGKAINSTQVDCRRVMGPCRHVTPDCSNCHQLKEREAELATRSKFEFVG